MTHSAEYACKAEPERQTLRKHLRQHGRATPAHVWASQCPWCRLSSWWEVIKQPVPYLAFDDLQQRVRKLEQELHNDGTVSG